MSQMNNYESQIHFTCIALSKDVFYVAAQEKNLY